MPPTPPSDTSTKRALKPTIPRSRSMKPTSGSAASAPAPSNPPPSNPPPVQARAGRGSAIQPPAGKRTINKQFDELFYTSPVPRSISRIYAQSGSNASNVAAPSSLRRSVGVSVGGTAATSSSTSRVPNGIKKAAGVSNGEAFLNFTLPNDGKVRLAPQMVDEEDGDDGDIIPAKPPVEKPKPSTPSTNTVMANGTGTWKVRGTHGKFVKGPKVQKEKNATDSPRGIMRNTASSRARATATASVKSVKTKTAALVGRTSTITATKASTKPTVRATRTSSNSSITTKTPKPSRETRASAPTSTKPLITTITTTTATQTPTSPKKTHKTASPSQKQTSPQKPPSNRKSKTFTAGFAVPPGILDATGSVWDHGRRKSRRSLGAVPVAVGVGVAPVTRRRTIGHGGSLGKRKSVSGRDAENARSAGKRVKLSKTPVGVGVSGSGESGSGSGSGKRASASGKVYVNTDFEFSDIEL